MAANDAALKADGVLATQTLLYRVPVESGASDAAQPSLTTQRLDSFVALYLILMALLVTDVSADVGLYLYLLHVLVQIADRQQYLLVLGGQMELTRGVLLRLPLLNLLRSRMMASSCHLSFISLPS